MTESPYIHHSPTLRCLLGPAVVFPDLEPHQRGSSGVLLGLAAGRHRPVDARGGRSPPSCQPPPSCSRGAWVEAGSALFLPPPAYRPQPPLKRREKAPSRPPALFRRHGDQGLTQSPDSRTGRTPALDAMATRPNGVTGLRSPIAQRERSNGGRKPEEG